MNHNITYDEAQIRRDVDTAKVVELLKKWRNERIMKGKSMRLHTKNLSVEKSVILDKMKQIEKDIPIKR